MSLVVSKTDFRDAMARVSAPVTIITTDGVAGRGGFTATAMCGVSDDPPTVLVCMNGQSSQCDMFLANKRYCVNVLTLGHQGLADKFAGGTAMMDERYAAAEWVKMASGSPALVNAIVNFDCEIETVHQAGTHNIMIGRVIGMRHRADGETLLYRDRTYVHLPNLPSTFGG